MGFLSNRLHYIIVVHLMLVISIAQNKNQFIYNGFHGAINLRLDGLANIHPNGLLQMTDESKLKTGHAFYPSPRTFKPNPSFSTTFVFAIYPEVTNHSGYAMVFVISPSKNLQHARPAVYLGIFNNMNNNPSNHVFAVKLDTVEIGGNHVGIDVNGPMPIGVALASYYSGKKGVGKSLLLLSGKPMQVWIDYDSEEMLVNVNLAPFSHPKPSKSLLSRHINLSSVLLESMYMLLECSYLKCLVEEGQSMSLLLVVTYFWLIWFMVVGRGERFLKQAALSWMEVMTLELELVLKLGLLCVHPKAEERPTMKQIVRLLDRDVTIPDIPFDIDPESNEFLVLGWGTSSTLQSTPLLPSGTVSLGPVSSVNSELQHGR